jgi:hypothetical protein
MQIPSKYNNDIYHYYLPPRVSLFLLASVSEQSSMLLLQSSAYSLPGSFAPPDGLAFVKNINRFNPTGIFILP